MPSYQGWAPTSPAYSNLFPTGSQVLFPSSEHWATWPNRSMDGAAYTRSGWAGLPTMW